MDKEILAGRAGTYDSSQRWTCSSLRKPLVRVDMEAWRGTKDGTRRLLLDRGWLAGALYTSPWGRPCTSYVHMQLMWPRDRVTETSPAPCPGQRPPRHREAPRHRTRKTRECRLSHHVDRAPSPVTSVSEQGGLVPDTAAVVIPIPISISTRGPRRRSRVGAYQASNTRGARGGPAASATPCTINRIHRGPATQSFGLATRGVRWRLDAGCP